MSRVPESLEKQKQTLRELGKPSVANRATLSLYFVALVAALAALGLEVPALWVFTGFFLVVAVVSRYSFPHFSNAARALDEGIKTPGTVRLHIWDDSDRYDVVTQDSAGVSWRFSSATHGWTPVEGQAYPAELCFLVGIKWPVLVITEFGLLYPNQRPVVAQAVG